MFRLYRLYTVSRKKRPKCFFVISPTNSFDFDEIWCIVSRINLLQNLKHFPPELENVYKSLQQIYSGKLYSGGPPHGSLLTFWRFTNRIIIIIIMSVHYLVKLGSAYRTRATTDLLDKETP